MVPNIIMRTDGITIFADSACIFVAQRFYTSFLLISHESYQRYRLRKLRFDPKAKYKNVSLIFFSRIFSLNKNESFKNEPPQMTHSKFLLHFSDAVQLWQMSTASECINKIIFVIFKVKRINKQPRYFVSNHLNSVNRFEYFAKPFHFKNNQLTLFKRESWFWIIFREKISFLFREGFSVTL